MTYEFLNDLLVDVASVGVVVSELKVAPGDYQELGTTTPMEKVIWRAYDSSSVRIRFDAGSVEIEQLIVLD